MTSATPKPRAGEHTRETDAFLGELQIQGCTFTNDNPSVGIRISDPPKKTREEIIQFARNLEAERDLLRERERELVEILTSIISASEESPSRAHVAIHHARALLAKHGR